jgi:hypothetical protein
MDTQDKAQEVEQVQETKPEQKSVEVEVTGFTLFGQIQ